jgi:hypothetical protein
MLGNSGVAAQLAAFQEAQLQDISYVDSKNADGQQM